ncbi:MAG: pyrroline-5-carboxylate reductase [Chloroflexota bacterium]|nr:pyrroline-5-carboxylate reductase [Chloroflexota bacterium]
MKLAFIGGGAMGEAMIRGVLAKGSVAPSDIRVCDIDASRLETLRQIYNIDTRDDYASAMEGADVIVLAVKPQALPGLMPEIKDRLADSQLVLSIIVGAGIDTIVKGLGHTRIVRAMPNTPAQIGAGITAWIASTDVTPDQMEAARGILEALGREIFVPDEEYIDMATAVSGSGPAYVFYMIEGLIEAATRIGLPGDIAGELALETVLGAARLARQTGQGPEELRIMVTSPGGTTAAGLEQLEKGNFIELISRAVAAAHKRAKELGDG